MWRKLLGLCLLLGLLLGLAWWLTARGAATPAARCEGSSTLLTYEGREALWCLDTATPDALVKAAGVTGPCAETLRASAPLRVAEHLTLRQEGGVCVLQRAAIPASQRFVLGVALNLNEATAEDLESLPGVGPAVARAIVEDRAKNGPFASVEELDRVKGIGPKTVERLRGFITVAE